MGKHKQTRKRIQKGGAWYNPLSWNQPTDPNIPRKSWGQWFSGTSNNAIQSADNAVGSAANFISTGTQNTFNRATNLFSSPTPTTTPTTTPTPTQINDNQSFSTEPPSTNSTPPVSDYSNSSMGGKRRRRTKNRRMKGGYKDNLAYYAAPVQGLKVAAPTYWISAKTNPPLSGGSKSGVSKRRVKKRLTRRKTYRNKK
jgi:hypothetical protein